MKKKLYSCLLMSMILFFLSGCYFVVEYKYKDLVTYSRNFTSSSKLKIDGYYVCKDSVTRYSGKRVESVKTIIFYRDGSMCADFLQDKKINLKTTDYFRSFGRYLVQRDSIIVQSISICDDGPMWLIGHIFTEKSIILNDSTLVFPSRDNDVYHFVPCYDCKPDSTDSKINKHLKKLKRRRNYWTFFGW